MTKEATSVTEVATETKAPTIFDKDISQATFEKLRSGETIPAAEEKSTAETIEASGATKEDAETKAEGEKEPGAEKVEGDKKPKKGGFKRRIEKLSAKNSALQQENEYWREQALKNSKTTADKPASETKPDDVKASGRPDKEKFESHDEYLEALVEWKAEQRFSAEKMAQAEGKLKAESESKGKAFADKVEAFKKDHSDYHEKLEEIDDIPLSLTVRDALLNSENGPELAYELAKNREVFERINKLPALAAAREIGRFEARIQKQAESVEAKETKTTKAPPPIKPIGSSTASGKSKSIYDPGISQADYERLREAQLKA